MTPSYLKLLPSLLLIIGINSISIAQTFDYKNTPTQKGSNYFEIVSQKRSEFQKMKSAKKLSLSENKAYKQFERWAYFWKDRVNADGSFPSPLEGWNNIGLLNIPKNLIKESKKTSKMSSEAWVNVGPQSNPDPNGYPNPPQIGRLNAFWRYVATDPSNNILIVGAPTGGIWKSINNGVTWYPVFDTYAGIGITDIKGSSGDATSPGVLYAATGDYDGNAINSIGVFKSTDMGETWIATNLTFNLNEGNLLGQMVVYDDNTVVIGTADSIKKTIDGGSTWNVKYADPYEERYARMAYSGTNIVCTDYWGGVYYSTDSGDTWDELITAGNYEAKLAVAADESGTFYIQNSDGQIQQLDLVNAVATDFGTIPADYNSQGGYNQVLVKREGLIIDGSVDGNASSNNGATWYKSLNGYWLDNSDPGVYMHSDHHQAGYLDSGLSFWNVNDGGLDFITFSSTSNLTPTVEYKSNGVVVTQIYTISIDPTNATSDDFLMANQDNDGFSKEAGTWVSVLAGDGVCSAIDYTNPEIRYMGGTNGSLRRSVGATGFSGNYYGTSLNTPGNAEFVWPLSLDTTTSTTLLGGFDDLYKSTNMGDTWSNLNAGVGNPITFDNQGVNIAVVGTGGLKRSSDGGTNWNTVNQPSGQYINSFSIDGESTNGNTIYATVRGYNDGNKVFKSLDGGSNWTNISGDLPNILMTKVLLKQNQTDEYVFVGTELGVYYTNNGGVNWLKLGTNLPNVIVNDMKINYLADKLFIGTYGRGMWSINIENSTLGTSELSLENTPKIYPNPIVNNVLNIHLSNNDGLTQYIIYNVVGGVIAKGTLKEIDNAINLNNPAKGIYILRINSGNKYATQKFIVK